MTRIGKNLSPPGANFISQKLRVKILLTEFPLNLNGLFFAFFWQNISLLSSFEETVTLKLSRIYSQGEKRGKFQSKF